MVLKINHRKETEAKPKSDAFLFWCGDHGLKYHSGYHISRKSDKLEQIQKMAMMTLQGSEGMLYKDSQKERRFLYVCTYLLTL